jgi:hypothetical protein
VDVWSAPHTPQLITQHSQERNIHDPGVFLTRNPSKRPVSDPRLWPPCHKDRNGILLGRSKSMIVRCGTRRWRWERHRAVQLSTAWVHGETRRCLNRDREIGCVCNTRGWEGKCCQCFWLENLKERENLEDLLVNGRQY